MEHSRRAVGEATTWFIIICLTLGTLFIYPWYIAENVLRYILIAAGVAAAFWYTNSNRLLQDSQKKTRILEMQQKELSRRQKTIDLIFEHSADGILVLDQAQKIISFSPGLERITGFSREEAINKPVKELLKFKGDLKNSLLPDMMFLADTLKQQPYTKNTLTTKEGREIDIEASSALIHKAGREGDVALAIIRDVTYEKELVRRDKEFIAITSHQLNTPLSIIQGYLSLMKNGKTGKITTDQEKYIDEVLSATTRMISLTNNLLSISRIEQEKIKLEKSDFNVADLLAKLKENFGPVATKKGLRVTWPEVKNNLILYADPLKISQALSNLIDNAIKYTGSGSVEIDVKEKNGNIAFAVSDTGIGISPEELGKIGEKFYRSQNAINIDNQGTGLGLFIAKTIIEKHGGRLEIKSSLGKGTNFSFTIPINIEREI